MGENVIIEGGYARNCFTCSFYSCSTDIKICNCNKWGIGGVLVDIRHGCEYHNKSNMEYKEDI